MFRLSGRIASLFGARRQMSPPPQVEETSSNETETRDGKSNPRW